MARNKKRNYVNNPDLLESLDKYLKECNEAENLGNEIPKVPDYIGHAISQIAHRLATKPNFSGYSFKEDMIMDGIENCLVYIRNFNPEKTNNPFAYFTQIIWNAFLRRIQKEKKQLYIQLKNSQQLLSTSSTYDGGEDVHLHLNVDADYIDHFIQDYEDKLLREKKKKEDKNNDTTNS